jgi:hypothetical protein
MNAKPGTIPSGLDHLAMIRNGAIYAANETAKHLDDLKINNDLIGTAMNVIYQAATCHRKCHGGAHTFERLLGRAYNLGCGAYNLTIFGLYDEALTLIRSLGEIANLVMLSAVDGPKIKEWLHASREERLKNFSPVKIRRMIKAKGMEPCANDKWYKEMSEGYTHITPDTKPNFHGGSAFVGGRYEKEGLTKCFAAMLYVLLMLAMFVARFFKFDDLFDEISRKMRNESDAQTAIN